ncbi:MAG: hypothetical protein QME60_00655 [Verrucomicrobiota bacterium]|nr:hypothetical protein [Verrucomicrobiota bacterium]
MTGGGDCIEAHLAFTSDPDPDKDIAIVEVMRDFGRLEHMGMGARRKIVKGMLEHNGTTPDLVEDGERFIARLHGKMPDGRRRS